MLMDILDAGSMERDADVVMFLHRDGYYNLNADKNAAEIIIAKNKNGSCGTIELGWDSKFLKFSDKLK